MDLIMIMTNDDDTDILSSGCIVRTLNWNKNDSDSLAARRRVAKHKAK